MFERLLCALFGHKYVVERVLNKRARKVGCTRCRRQWAMHDPTKSFLPWDQDFEDLYAIGGMLHEKESDMQCEICGVDKGMVDSIADHLVGDHVELLNENIKLRELIKQSLETLELCVSTCFDQYSHEQVLSNPEHFVNQTLVVLRRMAEEE